MVATLTDTSRDTWLQELLSTPASEYGFYDLRAELITNPPTEDELTALLAFVSTWNTGIRRVAPIEWLWRVSRGEACPELALCNAIDPEGFFHPPLDPDDAYRTYEDGPSGVWTSDDDYVEQLVRDEVYIGQQISIDEWMATTREGGHDDV